MWYMNEVSNESWKITQIYYLSGKKKFNCFFGVWTKIFWSKVNIIGAIFLIIIIELNFNIFATHLTNTLKTVGNIF